MTTKRRENALVLSFKNMALLRLEFGFVCFFNEKLRLGYFKGKPKKVCKCHQTTFEQ